LNRLVAFLSAGILAMGLSTAASAAVVTFNGDRYEISTIELPFQFVEQSALVNSARMPWFGSISDASFFAREVGFSLGIPSSSVGPLFAFGTFTSDGDERFRQALFVRCLFSISNCDRDSVDAARNAEVWAFATKLPADPIAAVPLPASVLSLLTGLVGAMALGFRKKATI
jgi:hypothetical protein